MDTITALQTEARSLAARGKEPPIRVNPKFCVKSI